MRWIAPEEGGPVPPDDRGFAYGDGLFETLLASQGRCRYLEHHLSRLRSGIERLGMGRLPDDARAALDAAVRESESPTVLKLIISRGSAGRGYRPQPDSPMRWRLGSGPPPSRPDRIEVLICRTRVPIDPDAAGMKTLNRLPQVRGAMELHAPVWEGLMCDPDGHVICGTRTNLFVREGSVWSTPELSRSGVAGVMRAAVMRALDVSEEPILPQRVRAADELLLTNSVQGVVSVHRLEGRDYTPSAAAIRLGDMLDPHDTEDPRP